MAHASGELDPATRSTMVYQVDGGVTLLHTDDALQGEPVLPGFTCRVCGLF